MWLDDMVPRVAECSVGFYEEVDRCLAEALVVVVDGHSLVHHGELELVPVAPKDNHDAGQRGIHMEDVAEYTRDELRALDDVDVGKRSWHFVQNFVERHSPCHPSSLFSNMVDRARLERYQLDEQ